MAAAPSVKTSEVLSIQCCILRCVHLSNDIALQNKTMLDSPLCEGTKNRSGPIRLLLITYYVLISRKDLHT